MDEPLGRPLQGVEGDEQRQGVGQVLEPVHPVGHADLLLVAPALAQEVPARPGAPGPGHQGRVRVQHGEVALVAEGPQQAALRRVRIGQQGQGLVGVGGDDHLVVVLGPALAIFDAHPLAAANDGRDRGVEPDAARKGGGDALHIGPAPAHHGAPLGPVAQRQEPVVLAEAHEGGQRVVEHLRGRGGPDGRPHGQQVIADEGLAVAVGREVGPQGQVRGAGVVQGLGGLAVEAQQVAHQAPHPRAQGIDGLGQQAAEPGPGVLEAAPVQGGGKGHLGGPGLHPEVVEQGHQVGVVAVVVDDEAGVHVDRPGGAVQGDGVGVAADAVVLLIDRDLVSLRQQPGRRQPRDPGPHHRDPAGGLICTKSVHRRCLRLVKAC